MKVSVIIPTYNSAKYVTEAIDSVLAQTYKNYEIIVIDDGSTDNTKELLKSYKKKIKYIYQENKGQAWARNTGIKKAKGELIAFLDADDVWLAKKLELQVPLFKDKEIGLVYGDIALFGDKTNLKLIHNNDFKRGYIFKDLIKDNFICISTTIIRKDVLDMVGLFNSKIRYVEDLELWLRVVYKNKIDYTPEKVVKYRVHPGNVSRDYEKQFKTELFVIKNACKRFNMSKKLKRDCLFNSYSRLSYFSLEDRKYNVALKALFNAILLKPFKFKNYKLLIKIILYRLIKK